jgi:crossover junction endodeoxyribonuclease RuvC
MRVLGLDPGLRHTGWGVIEADRGRLSHVAHGAVTADVDDDLAMRLVQIHDGLVAVIALWRPDEAAVEESFANQNRMASIKLGLARGVALLVPAKAGLKVAEYGTNHIKRSIVGNGHAEKLQVQAMVRRLLPGAVLSGADAADALAVAICHAHHAETNRALERVAR